MVVDVRWLFWASGLTVWPFIFVRAGLSALIRDKVVQHERVHWRQQRRWVLWGAAIGCGLWAAGSWPSPVQHVAAMALWGAAEGAFLGLLLWRACYLLLLPVGWNPWRWRWEMQAYRAIGYRKDRIATVLRGPPYYLRWHR